jgi:hypothetical protein
MKEEQMLPASPKDTKLLCFAERQSAESADRQGFESDLGILKID